MPRGGLRSTSGQGRPKGTPNRVTGAVKDMIRGALDAAGGLDYLTRQAEENPVAFMTLVGKLVPVETSQLGPDGKPIDPRPSITWVVQK